MRKKAVVIMLLTTIIINSLTCSIATANIEDNATGGGSSSGLTSGNGSLNWSQAKSGYRFSIIDRAGNVIGFGENGKSGSVDILFMEYKGINTPYYYTSAKTQPLSSEQDNKRLTIDELYKEAGFKSKPPVPISTNGTGTAKGNGNALRDWMMAGKKWIGQHTTIKKPSQSAGNNSNNSNTSNTSGSNKDNSHSTYDIAKAKTDIISSGKKLKSQLDNNASITYDVKLKTIHSWMDQLAIHYTKMYNDKKITKADYDEIILGTALDMMAYMQHSNFKRSTIPEKSYNIKNIQFAIDSNINKYISGINDMGIYEDAMKARLIDYYIEGEINYYNKLYLTGDLNQEQSSLAINRINLMATRYKKTLKVSSIIEKTTRVAKSDVSKKQGEGSIQSFSIETSDIVNTSLALTNNIDENATIMSFSVKDTGSTEEQGEITKLLNAMYKGKPLFELPEHSLPEYAGKSTVYIMVDKGYMLLVENLTYIQPATWNSNSKSAGVYFKYHIFGTITNYAECLTLLKSKGYWLDMSGGAYSTPTSKLGWSCLMIENDSKNMEISFIAPTKQEGTRRTMNELASASDLSKGVIEGFGMQLYLTDPSEDDIPTPTPTPVVTSYDSGVILHENEIAKSFDLLHSYEGDRDKLKITSSISEVTDKTHTMYCGGHGEDEEGNPISCTGHSCVVSMQDNSFNHIYKISRLKDSNNVIAEVFPFTSELVDNATGLRTVGLSGNNDIAVYPNYNFNIFRSMDKPTLVDYANSEAVKTELGALGLSISNGGKGYQPSRLDNGSNQYKFNLQIEKDGSSDTTTTYSHSRESITGSQTHTLGEAEHDVDVTIRTYVGNENVGAESSDVLANSFKVDKYTMINPTRYIINPNETISFYPYVHMKYTSDNKERDAYVLSDNISKIRNSEFIEVGYIKSKGHYRNILLDSNQWSNHKRSTDFIKENNLGDRYSVLPGGATYTIKQIPDNKTYVGVRSWQTEIPDSNRNHIASGVDYYSSDKLIERRKGLIDDINSSLSKLHITQSILKGIENEQKDIIQNGVMLNKIADGKSQTVYDNNLSMESKYYLKTNTAKTKANSNAIFIATDRDKQLVREVRYTISSDTDGNVHLYKCIDNGVEALMGFIDKMQSAEKLINLSGETKELDDKTKMITNYVNAIDRSLGVDSNGKAWYNEAFGGISVILSEYLIELDLKDSRGNGAGVRTSALDPKLVGMIDNKSDIYNFKDANKIRSSCFAINPYQHPTIKGLLSICDWGGEDVPVQLKNMEYLFISKTFYIPNATVMDLGR